MLTDAEIRHTSITLLTQQTERDKQIRIGASTLADGCDYCLACAFLGISRDTPLSKKVWMGATWGTAQHAILEQRVQDAKTSMLAGLSALAGAEVEKHVFFANIEGYGEVGGSIDLLLPDQIVDWKGSTRKKTCLLLDYMAISRGLPAPYGRTHKEIKLSEKEYESEMAKQRYKVFRYVGQQSLYMKGSNRRRASLVFLNRDGTGYFDVPADSRYDDPTAVHDVNVVGFDYDADYADALIHRGSVIWAKIQEGAAPSDFHKHQLCWPCSVITEPTESLPDIEVSFGAVA
jgi:hypothetical protein